MADAPKPAEGGVDAAIASIVEYPLRGIETLVFGSAHKGPKKKNWYEKLVLEYLPKWGISSALLLWISFIGLLSVLGLEIPDLASFTFNWLVGLSPVWLPIALWIATFGVWVWYIQGLFLSGRDPVLLDVRIPRDVTKSPRAMEIALISFMTGAGESQIFKRLWRGNVRAYYSLEYASFGGEVHMYVWTWKDWRAAVEYALYAQFPEIEIHQVPDYASHFNFDPQRYAIFATDFKLALNDAVPIKTYIDFELDKDPKEEFRIEPLAQMFEYLGSLKPGEQAWVQIIFRQSGPQGSIIHWNENGADKWRKERVTKMVREIRKQASVNPGMEDEPDTNEKKYGAFPRPTWQQNQLIEAIERNSGKMPFDVGIRALYITDKTKTSPVGSSINALRNFWKPLSNPGYLNSLNPARWHNDFDFPWQDFNGIRDRLTSSRALDAYRRRSYFFAPWETPHFVMTNEALATLWHFPSRTIAAPGLERIPATKAEPPANLPK